MPLKEYQVRRKALLTLFMNNSDVTSLDIANEFNVSDKAAAHILRRMAKAGFLLRRKVGKRYFYNISKRGVEMYDTYPGDFSEYLTQEQE